MLPETGASKSDNHFILNSCGSGSCLDSSGRFLLVYLLHGRQQVDEGRPAHSQVWRLTGCHLAPSGISLWDHLRTGALWSPPAPHGRAKGLQEGASPEDPASNLSPSLKVA